jgi:subtilisin-like proprotein convertase family protein
VNVDTFSGQADLNIGRVVGGTTAITLEPAVNVPDNNAVGVTGLINFAQAGLTITRLTVDVEIRHPDIGELTVTLQSPVGTTVVLHNPGAGVGVDLIGNFDRRFRPVTSSMDAFYGENPSGAWRLNVKDGRGGNVGQLATWRVNVNESWSGGAIFASNEVRTDGWVVTDTGVEVRLGGDLVFRNSRGEVTRRIDGELPPAGLDIVKDSAGNTIRGLFSFDASTDVATLVTRIAGTPIWYLMSASGTLTNGFAGDCHWLGFNCIGQPYCEGAGFRGVAIDTTGRFDGVPNSAYPVGAPQNISTRSRTRNGVGCHNHDVAAESVFGVRARGAKIGVVVPPSTPLTFDIQ